MYFIKNNNSSVASVEDRGNDLHWYVLPKFRKKGILNQALNEVILPHLFQNKDRQVISIDRGAIGSKNASNSEKVALRLGFSFVKQIEDIKYYSLERNGLNLKNVDFENKVLLDLETYTKLYTKLRVLWNHNNILKAEFEIFNIDNRNIFSDITNSLMSLENQLSEAYYSHC